jgi:hypothetical protein
MCEQVVDDARKFMGGGDNGRLGTEAGPHAPIEGPQAIVAATHRLRRQSEGLTGPIASLERTRGLRTKCAKFQVRSVTF